MLLLLWHLPSNLQKNTRLDTATFMMQDYFGGRRCISKVQFN